MSRATQTIVIFLVAVSTFAGSDTTFKKKDSSRKQSDLNRMSSDNNGCVFDLDLLTSRTTCVFDILGEVGL